MMSVKHRLHSAVEDLPESVTLEEAVERLYYAFKMKRLWEQLGGDEIRRALEEGEADLSAGRVHSHADVAARYQALLDGEPQGRESSGQTARIGTSAGR